MDPLLTPNHTANSNINSSPHSSDMARHIHLLPKHFEHNYESPTKYMTQSRAKRSVNVERVKDIIFSPLARSMYEKTMNIIKQDPTLKYVNNLEEDKQTTRNRTNYAFTKFWKNLDFLYEDYLKHPEYMPYALFALSFTELSVATKVGVHFGLYAKSLLSLGTQIHDHYKRRAFTLEDYGCFMLTEMGHGSNVQGIITTATYDRANDCFVVNTPHQSGAKFWIGNLAQTANNGILFAQLIIDGKNQGPHAFLIHIRDEHGNIISGMTIGDCGTKMGLNGVDNGWATFKSTKLPRAALLNRFSNIDDNGVFTSKIKKKSQRFAVQIGALSGGRIGVAVATSFGVFQGTGIALRYATVRKQFGEKKGMENVLMDYPLVHSKLITRLSNGIVTFVAADLLNREWNFINPFDMKSIKLKEIHALSSYIKTAGSWNLRESLSIARELCGGHGYSAYSHLPVMIKDLDVHVTWEGTNEVLLQQTCKNLVAEFSKFKQNGASDYTTLQFLNKFESGNANVNQSAARLSEFFEDLVLGDLGSTIRACNKLPDRLSLTESKLLSTKFDAVLADLQVLMELRVHAMVDRVLAKLGLYMTQVQSTKNSQFKSFNKTLPHLLFPAATFYGELFSFRALWNVLSKIGESKQHNVLFKCSAPFGNLPENKYIHEKIFFQKALIVFACSTLSNSAMFFVDIEEALDAEFFDLLNDTLLQMTEAMRYDALVMSDIPNPEFLDISSIGGFNGDVYNDIKAHIWKYSHNFGKSPQWDTISKLRKENAKK